MIINQHELLELAPIKNMVGTKQKSNSVSWGLSEAGYDICIKQDIHFKPNPFFQVQMDCSVNGVITRGTKFTLASAIEEFDMPDCLVGIVHDKSTWARKGLSVFNTVIEPGWKGFLTLELVYHGNEELIIPAGSGIAQVIFHRTSNKVKYTGKYQNQENKPVASKFE